MAGNWRTRAWRAAIVEAVALIEQNRTPAAYRLLLQTLEDVPPPLPREPLPPRPCENENCGAWYQPLRPHGRYCSDRCRRRAARKRARS